MPVVSIIPGLLYPCKRTRYPVSRRLGGFQNWSGHLEKRRTLAPALTRTLDHPAVSVVTILPAVPYINNFIVHHILDICSYSCINSLFQFVSYFHYWYLRSNKVFPFSLSVTLILHVLILSGTEGQLGQEKYHFKVNRVLSVEFLPNKE
jgi:hypothetical protein